MKSVKRVAPYSGRHLDTSLEDVEIAVLAGVGMIGYREAAEATRFPPRLLPQGMFVERML